MLAIFIGLRDLVAAHPVLGTFYLVAFSVLAELAVWQLWCGKPRRAFWCAVGAILVDFLFAWGDDTFTHIYRITAIADQLRHGVLSQFLVNPTTGGTLPVFVYYNVLPYVIPTALNLLGVPAFYAHKLAMCGHFVLIALGFQALLMCTSAADASARQRNVDQLVAFLFITANYVYCLWCTRGALAELWSAVWCPGSLRPSHRVAAKPGCRGGGDLQRVAAQHRRPDAPRRRAGHYGRGAGRAVLAAAVPVAGLHPGAKGPAAAVRRILLDPGRCT